MALCSARVEPGIGWEKQDHRDLGTTPEDVIGMIVEIRSKSSLYGVTVRSWGPRAHRGVVN